MTPSRSHSRSLSLSPSNAIFVLFTLAIHITGVHAQSQEPSAFDSLIANLCNVNEGDTAPPSAPAAPSSLPTSRMTQTKGKEVTLQAQGAPDAVWITDEYLTVLNYAASPTFPLTLTFNPYVNGLKYFAHYSSCVTLSTATIATWEKTFEDFVTSDAASFNSAYTAAQKETVRPTISNVDYAAKTVRVSWTHTAGMSVPYIVTKDQDGVILSWAEQSSAPSTNTPYTSTVSFDDSTTSITACTLVCTTEDITDEIVSWIEGSTGSTTGTQSVEFKADTLSVKPTCNDAVLFAKSGSAVVAFVINQDLVVNVEGLSTIVVKQKCATTLTEQTVSLDPLRTQYQTAIDSATSAPATQEEAPTCQYDGKNYTYSQPWVGRNGESCLCVDGVSQCGGVLGSDGFYMGTAALVVVTLSAIILFIVIVGLAYFFYMQKISREILEGKRKNKSGQMYFGSSATGDRGEVELPGGGQQVGMDSHA